MEFYVIGRKSCPYYQKAVGLLDFAHERGMNIVYTTDDYGIYKGVLNNTLTSDDSDVVLFCSQALSRGIRIMSPTIRYYDELGNPVFVSDGYEGLRLLPFFKDYVKVYERSPEYLLI